MPCALASKLLAEVKDAQQELHKQILANGTIVVITCGRAGSSLFDGVGKFGSIIVDEVGLCAQLACRGSGLDGMKISLWGHMLAELRDQRQSALACIKSCSICQECSCLYQELQHMSGASQNALIICRLPWRGSQCSSWLSGY